MADIATLYTLGALFVHAVRGSGATETYNGSEYKLIETKQDYETSKQACVDLGGHLAVITREEEHKFISDMIKNAADSQDTWIGLYQDTGDHADHRWVDGTPFVLNDPGYYQPWLKNDPNEKGAGAVRLLATTYQFADRSPSNKYWAMCEKSAGGRCLIPGGAWSQGSAPQGWGGMWRRPVMATAAGGTHPTGLHSCSYL